MNAPNTWLAIGLCISQSAFFSGMNLAVFSLGRLRLEATAQSGDERAVRVLALRRNSNLALATILWGNVAVNVLLTILADSVLAGAGAFLFSTVVITFLGEIFPQAYFSHHALRVAARLAPLLRLYQVALWPVVWPTAKLLDAWVGTEGMPWYRERELSEILRQHARDGSTEVSRVEAIGAINFLALDDIPVGQEGEVLDARSILRVPEQHGRPMFPPLCLSPDDPFLRQIESSGRKWVVLADPSGEPRLVMNAHAFLRAALFQSQAFNPAALCHRPLVVRDRNRPLGQVLGQLTVRSEAPGDDVVDEDLILVWTEEEKRILTGSDILGRLLRGIVRTAPLSSVEPASRPPHASSS